MHSPGPRHPDAVPTLLSYTEKDSKGRGPEMPQGCGLLSLRLWPLSAVGCAPCRNSPQLYARAKVLSIYVRSQDLGGGDTNPTTGCCSLRAGQLLWSLLHFCLSLPGPILGRVG